MAIVTRSATHAHMTTAPTGAVVTSHADCSCGWVGTYHQSIDAGTVLAAWNMAVGDRNTHKLTHQERLTP